VCPGFSQGLLPCAGVGGGENEVAERGMTPTVLDLYHVIIAPVISMLAGTCE
jgi:hypothetical protein